MAQSPSGRILLNACRLFLSFPLSIVSHLVVYEVCKHRRNCLAKTM
ncbi:hypothetical protein Taro_044070, partial [Colocasia esculenta]|nr:hypothetical protein [Colocasia esculenta]